MQTACIGCAVALRVAEKTLQAGGCTRTEGLLARGRCGQQAWWLSYACLVSSDGLLFFVLCILRHGVTDADKVSDLLLTLF